MYDSIFSFVTVGCVRVVGVFVVGDVCKLSPLVADVVVLVVGCDGAVVQVLCKCMCAVRGRIDVVSVGERVQSNVIVVMLLCLELLPMELEERSIIRKIVIAILSLLIALEVEKEKEGGACI